MGRIGGIGAAFILISFGIAQPSAAQQQSILSAAGFTGYSVTPNAHLIPWGILSFSYDSQVVGGPTLGRTYSSYNGSGHNFVTGFGVLPNWEISGRLATSTIQSNCYSEGCGIRDLSFNTKFGFVLDEKKQWNVAFGATDFGGNANFFQTIYGVVTYSFDRFDSSIGYARRAGSLVGGAKPLDGLFGNVSYQPTSWLQGYAEYNDRKAWIGARLLAPTSWLPNNWSAHIAINSRIAGDERTSKSWIGLGLSIPLYKVPTSRSKNNFSSSEVVIPKSAELIKSDLYRAAPSYLNKEFSSEGLSESPALVIGSPVDQVPPGANFQVTRFVVTQKVPEQLLIDLAEDFRVKGFEDISVGTLPNGAVGVRVNNATYNVNTIDGLGVALGVLARKLGNLRAGYTLVLTQRQVAIVGVTGQADCLAEWVAMRPVRCIAGQIFTPGTSDVDTLLNGVAWQINGKSPSWATVRLIVQPVLNSAIATEYGVFDYSVGLRATLQQPLWRGAYAEISKVSPLSDSKDYRVGQVFGNSRLVNATDRVMLHQVIRLPVELIFGQQNAEAAAFWGANAVTAHFATGRLNSSYRGAYGELRWEPFEGHHRIGLEGGRFERTTYYDFTLPVKSRSFLASYRYSISKTKTDLELTVGQFLYNDRGAQFQVTQWFDDVSLSMYIRRTKYEFENFSRTFAGIELSIPFTPRKDMNPAYKIQVTGAPQWFYGIETRVGSTNFINSSQGIFPGAAILDRTFNYDRAGMHYIEDNMARLRSAASE